MSFSNATSFFAIDAPYVDARGRDVIVAIVKATFDIGPDGALTPAEEPAPIRDNDIPWVPDDPRSSLRFPCDICAEKRGTDVIVVGEAVSRTPVKVLDVAVKVRGTTAPLRVHGERLFYHSVMQVLIGPAAPFERKPIVYERAYGGMSDDFTLLEPQNPSGVGLARRKTDLVGTPAPQIEHPALPHTSAGDRHPPVGFGPIAPHWTPRATYFGTTDALWMDTRLPLPPLDHDVRYNNVAHPALQLDPPLVPGDEITVLGMTLDGLLRFRLPDLGVVVRARFDQSGKVEERPPIDTVLLRPSDRQVEVVLRKAFLLGRGRDALREIVVDAAG
jgi:hypothetical protein